VNLNKRPKNGFLKELKKETVLTLKGIEKLPS
jgi:hypothetical protein